MKAPKFTDAPLAFIIMQGEDGTLVVEIRRKAGISYAPHISWKKKNDGYLELIGENGHF